MCSSDPLISENAKAAGLSLSEYICRQLIRGKVIAKYELVADMPEPKKFISEFGKIGNNLNQIARHFNSGGIHSQEMRKAIGQNLSEIFKMKKEVLKMAGDFQSPDGCMCCGV